MLRCVCSRLLTSIPNRFRFASTVVCFFFLFGLTDQASSTIHTTFIRVKDFPGCRRPSWRESSSTGPCARRLFPRPLRSLRAAAHWRPAEEDAEEREMREELVQHRERCEIADPLAYSTNNTWSTRQCLKWWELFDMISEKQKRSNQVPRVPGVVGAPGVIIPLRAPV